jgi:hypothetical protein
VKYFYVLSSTYSSGDEWTTVTLDSIGGNTVENTTTYPVDLKSFYFSHAAEASGMSYGSTTFIPLTTPLTSTSWDGDSFSTTAKTKIDLSAVFGAPAGIKAVYISLGVKDSASQTSDTWIGLDSTDTPGVGLFFSPYYVNDRWARGSLLVPCDANGDIYYQIQASGAGTFDVVMRIWGYFI